VKIAKGLSWMALGYGAAVLVATFVTVAMVVAVSALPDNGRLGSFYALTKDVLGFAYVGLIVTSGYALPGWLISVGVAARRAEIGRGYFVVTGGLTAVLAHLILSGLAGSGPMFSLTREMGGIFIWSILGGLCGGWAYWRVAVVRFGRWRVRA
jgi:hypothetical protein